MAETSRLVYLNTRNLSVSQRRRSRELQKECFSRVSRKESTGCFIAKRFGWVFAYEGNCIVGQVELFSRNVRFEGRSILLGGLGGTCVTTSARNRGVGSRLVKKGMEILTQKNCDIASLNANIKNYPSGGLYYRLGFRLMTRPISFTDVNGKMKYDSGEMFAPVRSNDVYQVVMKSRNTFHMGRGYW